MLERVAHRRCRLLGAGVGQQRDRRRQARLLVARRHDADLLVGQLGGALGGHEDVGRVGQDDDLLGRHLVDPREQLVGRGIQGGAAVQRVDAQPFEERRHARPRADRERAAARTNPPTRAVPVCRQALRALLDLGMHVRDVQARDLAGGGEDRGRPLGLVGVDVDLERRCVADHEHAVADLLQRADERVRVEVVARDGEVRAVAVGRGLVLGMGHARRRGVVLELGCIRAAQRGHDPGEQDRHAVPAGVDDAGVLEHGQQVGAALDARLAGRDRAHEDVGDDLVLQVRLGVGAEAAVAHVRELGRRARGHLAHHREHRALGGIAHGFVRALRRAGHRGRDQHRVHQLAWPRDQLLSGAADQLAEDDAAVAARPQQRGAGDRLDDLIAPDLVERAVLAVREAVDLLQHGAQRERHVVAGVAVGDGEDVEVVDLLAARLEVRQGAVDDGAEAKEAGIGRHGGRAYRGIQRAFWTLPALRQRVQT